MQTLLYMYVIFGLLLAALSVPMLLDKVPPNPWYGFRVPSTLADETLWYKINRHMARWLLLTGILTAVAAVVLYRWGKLSVDTYAWLCLLVFAVPFTMGAISSWRYLQQLKGS
ncbi:membrane protein of unknown function [Candidatus Promineifilum breve]|uniref:SdpI/YhfL protein family n=1 Tax=Candidatus Promineifilum breve TaxID=1806508 RepID=A0A160T6N3_9CHLR|nr:SdpI family protein [Candidatus Promineifilum breve]CUS06036.1 membrane protein of unknown function [Candidatus Promineifilum breve]